MQNNKRKHKRYTPNEPIKGIVFPISQQNITTQMVDVHILNYSDGGVLVQKRRGRYRPKEMQDVYFLLTIDDETIFTLKGSIIRIDNKETFAVRFNEAVDNLGQFPQEDIMRLREKLMQRLVVEK